MEILLADLLDLRREIGEAAPAADAAPPQIADALTVVRGLLDRMEEIYSRLTGMHGSARRSARQLSQALDDAADPVYCRLRDEAARRGGNYSTGRERAADVNLETLEQRRAHRQAEILEDVSGEILERARLAYRGADGARQDLNTRLRFLQWESNLER
jgi:hypothetical protein